MDNSNGKTSKPQRPTSLDLNLKSHGLDLTEMSISPTSSSDNSNIPLISDDNDQKMEYHPELDVNQNSTNTLGFPSNNYRQKSLYQLISSPPSTSSKPKNLMEALLVAKMEQAALGRPTRQLVRTDSADSASSVASVNSTTTSDVCKCDDCLLGIGDYWQQDASNDKKEKVRKICS
ncbi:unnamed protein product [Psylliodes chrysocephalus]|uniref:Uncharacterized protein n=1 Tax=Psylliodes chrysocephalus TaxID=3402493 RepID=A0A9P0CY06_9CUCU|nr:unnamed protein product [Psylliodes chrysocephala]